jgi:hypothetical protein
MRGGARDLGCETIARKRPERRRPGPAGRSRTHGGEKPHAPTAAAPQKSRNLRGTDTCTLDRRCEEAVRLRDLDDAAERAKTCGSQKLGSASTCSRSVLSAGCPCAPGRGVESSCRDRCARWFRRRPARTPDRALTRIRRVATRRVRTREAGRRVGRAARHGTRGQARREEPV